MSEANSSSSMAIKDLQFLDSDDGEESISDSFVCCVCLDLLYKPIVLGCGHVSCFWCVHKSMDGLRESHCPICRNPYHHFPTICEMLYFLLLKLYPVAYERREKQVLEEEKQMGCFSPQLDGKEVKNVGGGTSRSPDAHPVSDVASTRCAMSQGKDCGKEDSNGSNITPEDNLSPMIRDGNSSKVSSTDVLCPACKQILFRPAVLNCGHVYCEACIIVPDDEIIICKVCESPHPTDFPNVCLEFNNFLEETFPEEYARRRQTVEHKQAQSVHRNPPDCSTSKKSDKKGFRKSFGTCQDFIPWWTEHGSKVHMGAGCDYCGVYPIIGDRYRCLDCVEKIGFDLCGDCYNTRSKRPGRFNQQHTPDHKFELVKQPSIFQNIMLRLVGGQFVDSSGAPIAVNEGEDPLDSWIAVDSDVADMAGPDGGDDELTQDTNTHDGSSLMEFVDAPETADNVSAPGNHDYNLEQNENNSPST